MGGDGMGQVSFWGASRGKSFLRYLAASPQGAIKLLPRAFCCVRFGIRSRGLTRQLPAILLLSGYAWGGFGWLASHRP